MSYIFDGRDLFEKIKNSQFDEIKNSKNRILPFLQHFFLFRNEIKESRSGKLNVWVFNFKLWTLLIGKRLQYREILITTKKKDLFDSNFRYFHC